jgi:hypothetical protein
MLVAEEDIPDSHHRTCFQINPEYKVKNKPEKIDRHLSRQAKKPTVIMQNFRGKGKIYDKNMTFLSEVIYDIYFESPDKESGMEWRGEITPADGIMPMGDNILEMKDGKAGSLHYQDKYVFFVRTCGRQLRRGSNQAASQVERAV